jgi:hypothetical protein
MKVSHLLENDALMTKYLQALVEKTKSFVPPLSEMSDALGDADIYPVNSNHFIVILPLTGPFSKMDISDLYSGSRETKRKLRAKTASLRAESPEFEAFKKQAKRMIRVWLFYGLREITLTHGPGVEIYKSSVEDFNPDEAFKLNKNMELLGSLKLLFYNDGSLNG